MVYHFLRSRLYASRALRVKVVCKKENCYATNNFDWLRKKLSSLIRDQRVRFLYPTSSNFKFSKSPLSQKQLKLTLDCLIENQHFVYNLIRDVIGTQSVSYQRSELSTNQEYTESLRHRKHCTEIAKRASDKTCEAILCPFYT